MRPQTRIYIGEEQEKSQILARELLKLFFDFVISRLPPILDIGEVAVTARTLFIGGVMDGQVLSLDIHDLSWAMHRLANHDSDKRMWAHRY